MQRTEAQFFDGLTAGRHDVHVALSDDRQAMIITGVTLDSPLRWPLMDLRALRDGSDSTRLILTRHAQTEDEAPRDPARLVIHDPELIDWMHRTRPGLFRTDLHKGTWRKIGIYSVGAVVAAGVMLFVILPAMANTLARIIPVEREIAFGKVAVRQMERVLNGGGGASLRCTDPAGLAALDKMRDRLTANRDMQYQISLSVFDHGMVNAFAAPGGQVVILRGLLDTAQGPDEVAGVLAHEIGHVESRDATRHALRTAGSAGLLTMLIGDFTGGAAIALVGEQLITAAYTRDAEAAADQFALDMLRDANISASGFARFFDELGDLQGIEIPAYLSSHPVTAERADQARDFARSQNGTRPILSDTEWQALRSICR
ncbi:M48 family metallopeptidase [Mameliella sediminis]|uniref:M48 family metallopeptidase n=1 Tax=Mameliella sediminis TaxID=2836866 RepID=UPI001C43A2A5|nr:M48 family metallopeptidase [Mameliella sediminis]MBV7397456.1 M48 family metallopeptidase [Mameliella sediminis]